MQGECSITYTLQFDYFLKKLVIDNIARAERKLTLWTYAAIKHYNYLTGEELQFEQPCSVWGGDFSISSEGYSGRQQ